MSQNNLMILHIRGTVCSTILHRKLVTGFQFICACVI